MKPRRQNRTRQPVTVDVANAFLASVDRAGSCWTWTGKTDSDGYGVLYKDYADFRAIRIAFEIAFDVSPGALFVCHRCDNPTCVRPDHLFLGTSQENTADRHAKGRSARGERIGAAKLTESSVLDIRASLRKGDRQVDIAKRYGVTQAAVSAIKLRHAWGHVA